MALSLVIICDFIAELR